MCHKINISNATVKMAGQLWYLSEELVTLALFDDDLDNTTQDKINIIMQQKGGKEKPLKRANINMKLIQEKTLVDFTFQKLRRPFKNLCIPNDFLEYPAASGSISLDSVLQKVSSAHWLSLTTMLNVPLSWSRISLAISQTMSNNYSLF